MLSYGHELLRDLQLSFGMTPLQTAIIGGHLRTDDEIREIMKIVLAHQDSSPAELYSMCLNAAKEIDSKWPEEPEEMEEDEETEE